MAKCELLEFYTEHEIRLYGAYFEGDPNLPVVVHIHGACGNFYESPLVHVLADQYTRNGIDQPHYSRSTCGPMTALPRDIAVMTALDMSAAVSKSSRRASPISIQRWT